MELGYGLAIVTEFNDWKVIGNQREYYSRLSFFPSSPYNSTYRSLTPFMEPTGRVFAVLTYLSHKDG
jgi:hypothetical protein